MIMEVEDKALSDWAKVCVGDSKLDVEHSAMHKVLIVISGDFRAGFINTIGEGKQGEKVVEQVMPELLG